MEMREKDCIYLMDNASSAFEVLLEDLFGMMMKNSYGSGISNGSVFFW